jgi:hypothetical protein
LSLDDVSAPFPIPIFVAFITGCIENVEDDDAGANFVIFGDLQPMFYFPITQQPSTAQVLCK